jgi:hypothetical protein
MSYAQWRTSYTRYFVHSDVILILVLGFYSGLSGRIRTMKQKKKYLKNKMKTFKLIVLSGQIDKHLHEIKCKNTHVKLYDISVKSVVKYGTEIWT